MLDPHGSLFIGGDHKRVDVGTSKADDLVASPIQLVVDINRKPAATAPALSHSSKTLSISPLIWSAGMPGFSAAVVNWSAKSLAAIGSPCVTIAARRGFISSPSS
ncbi:hypothetical protein [Mesorhizobium sp. M0217]|uniref:hypothetical protein n=1 Tax=unclassified Mesorhizobium TaxID=325217 RepID=UPI003338AF78